VTTRPNPERELTGKREEAFFQGDLEVRPGSQDANCQCFGYCWTKELMFIWKTARDVQSWIWRKKQTSR
jgi:hypothetical protein